MNLLTQTKYLIKKTGLKPDRLKGQNFCLDEKVIKEMVRVAKISKNDTVLEVGAGFGFLTVELLKSARKVLAVELDKKLIAVLKNLGAVHQNLEIVQDDILKLKTERLLKTEKLKDYKIVSNLPYSITSAFLKKFLTSEHKPQSMTLLVQKEVAERICASPGQMNLLAISVQLYGEPKIIKTVSKTSFWPKPEVESAILQISNIKPFFFSVSLGFKTRAEQAFWRVVRSGFCSKRKQLHNNLASSLHLPSKKIKHILAELRLKPTIRAQELSIADWVELSGKVSKLISY